MSYKMMGLVLDVDEDEVLGQSWNEESVEERLALCEYQTITPHIIERLPKKGRILEAGCGLGRWVFYLKSLGYDILGIEKSKKAIKLIKEYDPGIPIEYGDVLSLGFPDNHFDAVISLGVVEHFEEGPLAALDETKRVLKPGGYLFISIPTQNLMRRLFFHPYMDFKNRIKSKGGKFVFMEYRFSRREFTAFLAKSSFEILETVPDELNHPKNIGLYTDFPRFRHKEKKWELNRLGRMVETLLKRISVTLYAGGSFFICRLKK